MSFISPLTWATSVTSTVEAGIAVESADLAMLPTSTVEVTDVAQVKGLMKLMDLLDDLDDVQDVHGNMDVSDDLMDEASA